MLESIRDIGPVFLIPAAWIVAALSIVGTLSSDGMYIAHVVMVVFISFFVATGWTQMERGALRAWRVVLLLGLPITLAGLGGFVLSEFQTMLHSISFVGWMVLPAGGFVYTARELPEAAFVYLSGAVLSVLGAVAAVAGIALDDLTLLMLSISLVIVGQTAGILDASFRDRL